MEKLRKSTPLAGIKKRKRKLSLTVAASEPKNIKIQSVSPTRPTNPKKPKSARTSISVESKFKTSKPSEQITSQKKNKKAKVTIAESNNEKIEIEQKLKPVKAASEKQQKKDKITSDVLEKSSKAPEKLSIEEMGEKYPVLKDRDLIEKFLKVQMNNNQKGRIRQAIKLSLQGASQTMFPDIIHGKIQAILNGSTDLTDSELRRIRILYNMLKTSIETPTELLVPEASENKINKKKKEDGTEKGNREKNAQKVKGPKRYVVFLGNLPLDINKEKIMNHFAELNESIKDIRLPKVADGKKSAIAYVELMNEPSYELALSKHHSMLDNKRINVLYSVQKNSKISKSQAKSKSAKLIALQKSGKLVGSTPMNKKRSHRRAIMKKAKAKEEAE